MSTPVRPKSFKSRIKKPIRSSIIKRPSGFHEKLDSSPIRHNPIARTGQREVPNAPKAKRVRQSRLFSTDSSLCDEEILPVFGNRLTPPSLVQLPVPRLYFENDDFMELYSDEAESQELSCDNRESITLLTQSLTDAFHTLLTETSLRNCAEMDVPELTRTNVSQITSTSTTQSDFTRKATPFGKVSQEQKN